jgi:hypothetical protein
MSEAPSNPIVIQVPAHSLGTAGCVSNAQYIQRVTLEWGEEKRRIFSGNLQRRMDTDTDESACILHPRKDNLAYDLKITFEYSSDGGATYQTPVAVFGPHYEYDSDNRIASVNFNTEDSDDMDNNDTVLTITFRYGVSSAES